MKKAKIDEKTAHAKGDKRAEKHAHFKAETAQKQADESKE